MKTLIFQNSNENIARISALVYKKDFQKFVLRLSDH